MSRKDKVIPDQYNLFTDMAKIERYLRQIKLQVDYFLSKNPDFRIPQETP